MVNFFVAGSDVVRWELTAVGPVYRLSVFHAAGTIVEYFTTTAAALEREHELEALFLASRMTDRIES